MKKLIQAREDGLINSDVHEVEPIGQEQEGVERVDEGVWEEQEEDVLKKHHKEYPLTHVPIVEGEQSDEDKEAQSVEEVKSLNKLNSSLKGVGKGGLKETEVNGRRVGRKLKPSTYMV